MGSAGADGEASGRRLTPLHGGRHSLPPDLVAFNQRERLLGAVATVVAKHGYNKTTVALLTEAAAVSRRTFYEIFKDKEECFLAAFDALDEYLEGLIVEAVAGEEQWPDQVAAALATVTRFFASRPDLARLFLIEAAAVGEGTVDRRRRRADRFIALLEPGRAYRSSDRPLAEGLEEALVGGVVTLVARRIIAAEASELASFVAAVIEFALTPYLGAEEARAVAARHG
jgi:AcrR family transcriptional regulator